MALFEHVDAEELQGYQPGAAALPRTAPRDIQQTATTPHHRPRIAMPSTGVLRHPRFGGVFRNKADGGGAQYSIGRVPTGQDTLGPVAPVMKAPKVVCCPFPAAFGVPGIWIRLSAEQVMELCRRIGTCKGWIRMRYLS